MLILPQITFGAQSQNLVTTLYTGTGALRDIVTRQDLASGELVWVKARNDTRSHQFIDTERGATKVLLSNSSNAQFTDANGLTSFNSNGFSLGNSSAYNQSGNTFVAWSFLQKAGFMDIVAYESDDTGQTVNHSLANEVGMMWVKHYTNTSTGDPKNWVVWHKDLTDNDSYLFLNSTAGEASDATMWSSTAPTSTQFSVGTNANVNPSPVGAGISHVAYLFAHNPNQGIACGSFTTDGSGNATMTGLGFNPRWVLIKSADDANSWILLDTKRGWGSGNDAVLEPDSNNTENASSNYGAPSGDGFTFSDSTATSSKHIYMAIR